MGAMGGNQCIRIYIINFISALIDLIYKLGLNNTSHIFRFRMLSKKHVLTFNSWHAGYVFWK